MAGATRRSARGALPGSVLERVLSTGLAHKLLPGLTVAGRYERFWADGLVSKAEIWSARNRFSLGAAHTLWKRDGFRGLALPEYRGTETDRPGGSAAIDWRNEVFVRLSIRYEWTVRGGVMRRSSKHSRLRSPHRRGRPTALSRPARARHERCNHAGEMIDSTHCAGLTSEAK
jgi:hypothetical protein